jgi:hypothetical protein
MRRTRVTGGLAAVGVLLLIVTLSGCGASGPGRASGPFAWLKPGSPPNGWNVARSSGATLAYPPDGHR